MVILVNPNSTPVLHIAKDTMEAMWLHVPLATLLWIDETYIEYVRTASLEQFATRTENVIICKSMSKVYSTKWSKSCLFVLCSSFN